MTFVKKHAQLLVAALLAVALSAIPRLVWGQDVEPPPEQLVTGGFQVLWAIIWSAGSLVVAGLVWLLGLLIGWLNEKHGHALWAGFLVRFLEALEDELQLGWDDLKDALAEARLADSPGGAQITVTERKRLGEIVWQGMKDRYGSGGQLVRLGVRLLGGDGERILKGKVARRVVDAVEGQVNGKPGPRRERVAPVSVVNNMHGNP